jgi:hypothetical protein
MLGSRGRSEAKREIERMADDILAKLDARLRQPLNELSSFFEWLRRVKFRYEGRERLVAAGLSAEMETFEKSMFSEDQVKALSALISEYRQRIIEMAKVKNAEGEHNA